MIFGNNSVQWGVLHQWQASELPQSFAWSDDVIACGTHDHTIRLWNSTEGLMKIDACMHCVVMIL